MLSEKENTQISKFLSLVLRHQPELLGLRPDEQGWVKVADLLQQANAHGKPITAAELDYVVETNSKKRFAFSDDRQLIRASQGHSIGVSLGYQPQQPPEILYHGTGEKSVEAIMQTGLEKRSRQHVHLSADTDTAIKVGQRHGKSAVFEVAAAAMHADGHVFCLSDNGVWLTEAVPVRYLKLQ